MRKRASREELEKALRFSRVSLPIWVVGAPVVSLIWWGGYRLEHRQFEYWVVIGPLTIPIVHVIIIAYCRWALRHRAGAK